METPDKDETNPPQYDSYDLNRRPFESHPETRHKRTNNEFKKASENIDEIINGHPDDYPFPKGKLQEKYEKHHDKERAWMKDSLDRAYYECLRILDQCALIFKKERFLPMQKQRHTPQELLHYYVYFPNPCQGRIGLIPIFIEPIITDLLCSNPQLGSDIQQSHAILCNKAKQIDEYLSHLRMLEYWNERNYTQAIAQFATLVSKLTEKLSNLGKSLQIIKPIKIEGLWPSPSLTDLRNIDSDPLRKGIPGDRAKLRMLKGWLKRHHKRPDIADTLDIKNGRIITTLPHRSIFIE